MYKINDKLKYRNQVCVVRDIKENKYSKLMCYVLNPISDSSLIIEVPVDKEEVLHDLITKEEIDEIIKNIPFVDIIEVSDTQLENEYKRILNGESHLDLFRIIKTANLRNQKRLEKRKKAGEKDTNYLIKAEKALYEEFSAVLDISFDETKKYVEEQVKLLTINN